MCCRVTVRYRFVGPGGDALETVVAAEAMDAGDKATSKAMSVAFRTALLQALALPTDDKDPDQDTYEVVGESTVKPNTGQGFVTSPRDGDDAQATQDVASPTLSVLPGGSTDDAAPEQATITGGEATATLPSGAASIYLTKDEQKELIRDYGSSKLVLEAFTAKFGEHIRRMADITCDMVEAMNE
jgi:hypothetical protein